MSFRLNAWIILLMLHYLTLYRHTFTLLNFLLQLFYIYLKETTKKFLGAFSHFFIYFILSYFFIFLYRRDQLNRKHDRFNRVSPTDCLKSSLDFLLECDPLVPNIAPYTRNIPHTVRTRNFSFMEWKTLLITFISTKHVC